MDLCLCSQCLNLLEPENSDRLCAHCFAIGLLRDLDFGLEAPYAECEAVLMLTREEQLSGARP